VVLWFVLHAAAHRLGPLRDFGFLARVWNLGLEAMARGIAPERFTREWRRVLGCLGIGGFSHLLFDIISHGGFPWLMPWVPKIRIYPSWWYVPWLRIPFPGGEEPYEIASHSVIWLCLSVVGIYLLFRPAFQKRRP
jgi:hypothetical protein